MSSGSRVGESQPGAFPVGGLHQCDVIVVRPELAADAPTGPLWLSLYYM